MKCFHTNLMMRTHTRWQAINLYKMLNHSNAPVEREFAMKRRLDENTMAACNYDREDERMRVTLLGPLSKMTDKWLIRGFNGSKIWVSDAPN